MYLLLIINFLLFCIVTVFLYVNQKNLEIEVDELYDMYYEEYSPKDNENKKITVFNFKGVK